MLGDLSEIKELGSGRAGVNPDALIPASVLLATAELLHPVPDTEWTPREDSGTAVTG